jgi:hypothetical protein
MRFFLPITEASAILICCKRRRGNELRRRIVSSRNSINQRQAVSYRSEYRNGFRYGFVKTSSAFHDTHGLNCPPREQPILRDPAPFQNRFHVRLGPASVAFVPRFRTFVRPFSSALVLFPFVLDADLFCPCLILVGVAYCVTGHALAGMPIH